MKKVLSLLFLSTLLLVSCGDDDSSSTSNTVDPSMIVGTWDYSDAEIVTTTSTTALGQTIDQSSTTSLTSSTATITFNADGTFQANGTTTFETVVPGSPNQSNTDDISGQSGTYVITGNEIFFTGGSFSGAPAGTLTEVTYTISQLTATRLVMELDSSIDQEFAGTTISIDLDGFIELTK